MDGIFEFWYLFPISIIIATIAISSGIGGAVFFSPLFIFFLKVDPFTAIGAGIITEVFGFSSGLYGYIRRKLIDFEFGRNLLFFSIPASIIGIFVSGYLPGNVLMIIFAVGIIFVGSQLFLSYRQDRETDKKLNIPLLSLDNDFESELTDYKGNIYRYTICNKPLARLFSLIGGLFFGMISVGLAELQEYQLLVRCRIPIRIAVATSIFLVAVTAFVVAGVRVLMEVFGANYNELSLIGKIILFTAPGVLIGGQIGPFIQHKIDPTWMKLFIAVTLVAIGLFLVFSLII